MIVVSATPDAAFVRRLAAELSLFGYQVEVETRATGRELEETLISSGAAALIAVDQSAQTAEVIVTERPGGFGPDRERERLDPRRPADTNAAVLAERFRARLTELGIAPTLATTSAPEPKPRVPLSPVVRTTEAPRQAEARLWAVAGLGVTSGGLGPMPHFELELRAFPARSVSTSIFGQWLPFAAKVDANEGHAEVRLLAGGARIDVYPIRGPLSWSAGLGALLVNAEMRGHAEPPWGGRADSVLVPAGIFESTLALQVATNVNLEVRGFVGSCSQLIAVRFAERKVAEFGRPFGGGTLALSFGWF